MKRFAAAVLVSCVLAVTARAQATTTVVRFTAVDSVEIANGNLVVSGIVEGEEVARGITFRFATSGIEYRVMYDLRQSCERLALLAMAKPAQFVLEVRSVSYAPQNAASCTLRRLVP
jgi:hypothetical protein